MDLHSQLMTIIQFPEELTTEELSFKVLEL